MQDIGVKITYRNEKMEPIYEEMYGLNDYTDMLRLDLLRLITDVEDLVYEMNGQKSKEEWTDASYTAFCKIRHKLLDKAGEIGRMPENMADYEDSKKDAYTRKDNNNVWLLGIDLNHEKNEARHDQT